MTKNRYLTLLRGINVGGNNIIKMADLKLCFESMGFSNVLTYIQSGNVIFSADENDNSKLTNKIEQALSERFKYSSRIVLISHQHLKKVINEAPQSFGANPEMYRYDVLFLKEPLTANELIKKIKTREGVDNVYVGDSVLYFYRLISKASQSHMSKIITLPEYQFITIRNWNTTSKLFALIEK